MSNKKNILFFFTDDQRFDTINALGNKNIFTPNIDKLVQSGVSFTQAHIPGGTVGAVCMPSRGMVHSGRTLFRLKDSGTSIPKEHITLGETLQKNGYDTFGTGKWHNGKEAFNRSFNNGDEIFFGGMNDHWNVPAFHYDNTGNYDTKKAFVHDFALTNKIEYKNCDHIHAGKHSTELFTDTAINYLNTYDNLKPFFLYVSLMAPHDPRTMPKQFLDMYNPVEIELPENFMSQHPFDTGALRIRDELLAEFPRSPNEIKKHIAEYYAMISHLDNEFGKLMKVLKEKDLEKDTVIIFSGDNGLALGQHGLMGKQNNYEHSIRIPLIFSGPGIPKNEKRDCFSYLLDIYPTICEMINIETPDSVDGKSLLPAIKENKTIRDYIYATYGDSIRSIKDKKYKLIEYLTEDTYNAQLFDEIEDPQEMNNLFYDKKYKNIVEDLRKIMYKYKEEWEDEKSEFGKRYWTKYRKFLKIN